MAWLGALAAIVLIAVVLIDAFEVMILPRRVSYPWRPTRLFYQTGWIAWRAACQGIPAGPAAATVPQRLWSTVAADAHGPVGPGPDCRLRVAALVARHAAVPRAGGRRAGFRRLLLFQRRHLLHPGLWQRGAAGGPSPCPERAAGGARVWVPGDHHQLSACALPGVLAAGDYDFPARRPGPARRPVRANCCGGWRWVTSRPGLAACCTNGSGGPPKCWKATCHSRF